LGISADSLSGLFCRGTCETISPHSCHSLLGRGWRLCRPHEASTCPAIIRHYPLGSGIGPGRGLFCRVNESNVSVRVGKSVVVRCVGTVSHAGRSIDSLISGPGAQFIVCFFLAAGIHLAYHWALFHLGIAYSPSRNRDPVSTQRRPRVGIEEVIAHRVLLTPFDP